MNDPIEIRMTELRATAKQYAKAEAQRTYLEDFKKSKMSLLMKLAEMNGVNSAAAQERDARASDEYIELLVGLRAAVEEAESLYWELQISMKGADLWRTRESTRRAEHKGYGN